MNTRSKTNAEFHEEVSETLARHESSFEQINAALQIVLTELQALRVSRNPHSTNPENPISAREVSYSPNTFQSNNYNDSHHHHHKLCFPKFNGEDLMGWIYKAEQYFQFQNIGPAQ